MDPGWWVEGGDNPLPCRGGGGLSEERMDENHPTLNSDVDVLWKGLTIRGSKTEYV